MPLAAGARLGPYRIDAEIGAGGMGHVFRATDMRLDRKVAVKVLPQHRWTDPQVRLRFEREARALSSLSHPHLCALYDVGEVAQSGATSPYIVMELLEGETLRDRLENRLNIRKALLWGAQIAEGLAAAHAKGVIHRDLKPENVFITEGELLKILDFGLATAPPADGDSSTAMRTDPGIVMGTAHYMSPEQVRGTSLDARTDIFSLGIVLFEMLTGSVPFRARSAVETMNAILVDDPPELPGVPDAVQDIVRRCLEKDPAQRFASAKDLAFALEAAAKSVHSTTKSAPRRKQDAEPSNLVPRLLVLALIAAGIAAAAWLSRDTHDPEPPRLRTLTWSGRDTAPAASPDGKLIAYVSARDGTRRIWLEQLADGTEAPVTAGPDDSAPRFSPDGSSLLFTRTANGASALYRVGVVGGDPRKLLDDAFDADWSPDGERIVFIRNVARPSGRADGLKAVPTSSRQSTVYVASIDGGAVRELASSLDSELTSPRWSPDQRWIAVNVRPRGTTPGSMMLVNAENGARRTLSRPNPHGLLSGAAWTKDGSALVYAELEGLAAVGLPRRRGSSVIVRHDVDDDHTRVLLRNPHSGADTLDIAPGGRIVFTEDVTRQSLQEVTLDGGASRWLSRGMSVDRQPAYAHAGASLVFASDRGGNVDLWEVTLDSGRVRRVTDHGSVDWDPQPNGEMLVWSSNRGGHFEVWTATLDGAAPRQVTKDGVDAENPSLPASGDWIYYDSTNPQHDGLWRIRRDGSGAEMIVAGETVHPSASADGQYVVYHFPGEPAEVRAVRVSDRQVFTVAAGISGVNALRAQWIGTTHTVAFRALDPSGHVAVFAQDFIPGTDTTATRRPLIVAEAETFAFSPDGKKAVLSLIDEASGLMMAEGVEGIE
ncbi:MAG TPA: protein kinase [Thermoanaerobaculia bacterium]|nr:protein kinase [Thermoanaerobaculia bacterium]